MALTCPSLLGPPSGLLRMAESIDWVSQPMAAASLFSVDTSLFCAVKALCRMRDTFPRGFARRVGAALEGFGMSERWRRFSCELEAFVDQVAGAFGRDELEALSGSLHKLERVIEVDREESVKVEVLVRFGMVERGAAVRAEHLAEELRALDALREVMAGQANDLSVLLKMRARGMSPSEPEEATDAARWLQFYQPGRLVPDVDAPVTSARVARIGGHDHLQLWVGGVAVGELVMSPGDAGVIAARLGLVVDDDEHKEGT